MPTTPCTRKTGAISTGCRCSRECLDLSNAASRAREIKVRAGIPTTIPAVVMARHIRAILARVPGADIIDLSHASKVSLKTLKAILGDAKHDPQRRVYLPTATKIMEVKQIPLRATQPVSAVQVQRQVEALAVQGWSLTEVTQRAGLKPGSLRARSRVHRKTAEAINAIYYPLVRTLGPSELSTLRAKHNGYAPWTAWSKETLPRARAKPDLGMVDDPAWKAAIQQRQARRGVLTFGGTPPT